MGQCQAQFHFTANNIFEGCFHKHLDEPFFQGSYLLIGTTFRFYLYDTKLLDKGERINK